VKDGINRVLWDETRGMYFDLIQHGRPQDRFSQHVNWLAILYGVAPREQWEPIYRRISDKTSGLEGRLSPFFHYYVHRALFQMGRAADVLQYLRDIWGGFLRMGLSTFPEGLKPSLDSRCHAYSCTPNVDLSGGILGVRPLAPGFREFALEPQVRLLPWAKGCVPTPQGEVRVSWQTDDHGAGLTFAVPAGTEAHLRADARQETFGPGEHRVRLAQS
jgi:hypothetical protein